jgi:rubredoxin
MSESDKKYGPLFFTLADLFSCPVCGKPLKIESVYAGPRAVLWFDCTCPACGKGKQHNPIIEKKLSFEQAASRYAAAVNRVQGKFTFFIRGNDTIH